MVISAWFIKKHLRNILGSYGRSTNKLPAYLEKRVSWNKKDAWSSTKSKIWWDFWFYYLLDYGWEVTSLIRIIYFRCCFGSMCCYHCCYCIDELPCWNSILESLENGPCKRQWRGIEESKFPPYSGRKSYVLNFAFLTIPIWCINTHIFLH